MLPIVVVGAGLAGATAAWSLATQGRGASVLVIESRQRLGGRLTNGVDVLDMGAAWTWPSHDSTLALLAKAAGVSSYRQVDKGAAVMDLGPGMVQATPGRVFSEELRFAGGSAAIPVGLLDEAQTSGNCEVKTGCAVTRIAQCDDGECLEVSYKCAGEGIVSTKASHVVLTVPPRLAHAKIAFDPALPAEVARAMSASPTWMADTAKVAFTFKEPFWRTKGLSGNVFSQAGPLRQIWDNSQDVNAPGARPALVGFAMGRDAADLAAGGDRADKVVSRAKEQLNRVFGPEAEEQIASEEHVAWGAEEWTRHEGGDHSEPPPRFGHPALRTELYRGRLILAGTETEDEHGHMEGAAKSGLRAANAILSALSSTEKEL